MPMKKLISLWLFVIVLMGMHMVSEYLEDAQAQQKKVLPDPTPRTEEILKLFVQEFIDLEQIKVKFPAKFMMGSDASPDSQPVHQVTIAKPFAMAKYEMTQELYHVVMGKNPSKWLGLRNGAEMMSWDEANTFCQKVTTELRKRKLIGDDEEIRLPTEAEWEFVCRAGTTTAWSFGDDVKQLGLYAWYKDNSKGYDPPVGAKMPNTWGFYDMHGYVSEWCADDWQSGYPLAPTGGTALKIPGAEEKVMRGGSFADPPQEMTCAYRGHVRTDTRSDKIGFRCVRAKVSGKKGGQG
jgi:formylglycine-generating enzyme required for sulfatase activity